MLHHPFLYVVVRVAAAVAVVVVLAILRRGMR
jgi:hypothetical protein